MTPSRKPACPKLRATVQCPGCAKANHHLINAEAVKIVHCPDCGKTYRFTVEEMQTPQTA